MNRLTAASALLLVGGVVLLVGLPLQWSSVATTDGALSVSLRGVDYAGYDIVTTLAFGLLLVAAAFGVAARQRWAHVLAVVVAVLACLWATLVVVAAANPTAGGTAVSGVDVSVGVGAYLVAIGAGLALIGSLLSFGGRSVAVVGRGAPSGV